MLTDDLLKIFGECLSIRARSAKDSSEVDDDARGTFLQGKQLSLKLAKAPFGDMLQRDDKTIFIKLSNALCMQASIELNCELRDIATQYTDCIAYNIGGKVLTTTNLASIV
jgi:hypothetical protein